MLAVVVPAHDEESTIDACLRSIAETARWPALAGEAVLVVVALDACTDRTAERAAAHGAVTVAVDARNVGLARAAGAALALECGARWLAFTDADTTVAPDWLSAQLAERADAVCGTVGVVDWGDYGLAMDTHFRLTYTDADGHRHVHGANLGVSAAAYRAVGGFPPLACSEDVALVDALRRHGASIAWSAAPRVVTSARRRYRAAGGFGATLERIHVERSHATALAREACP